MDGFPHGEFGWFKSRLCRRKSGSLPVSRRIVRQLLTWRCLLFLHSLIFVPYLQKSHALTRVPNMPPRRSDDDGPLATVFMLVLLVGVVGGGIWLSVRDRTVGDSRTRNVMDPGATLKSHNRAAAVSA